MEHFERISPKAALMASAICGAVFISVAIVQFLLRTRRPPGFPPGPPTQLGLGNLHQVPLQKPFLKFHEWSKTYGDIIGLKMGHKNFVILSSPALMREVFVKRGAKYGGRPPASISVQHVLPPGGSGLHILFTPYDQYLKRWRGAARHLLTQDAVMRQGELMSSVGDKLVYSLLHRSEDWKRCIQRWALEVPLLAIAGRRLEDYRPGFVEWYLDSQHDWLEFLEPSNTPAVELVPWLRFLPSFLATWKRQAASIGKTIAEMYFTTLAAAQKKAAEGRGGWDSLYSHLLRQREQPGKQGAFSDTELAFLGGGLLDAALDTTLASLQMMILCLVGHQDVMRRAKEEVDDLCGERMPRCEDLKNLPFLMACFNEALRWRSPTNTALPHLLTEDDVLEGHTIPKGTTVLANIHSMHLRKEEYDLPDEFIPDRFLEARGQDESPVTIYSFSFGRRGCPGEDFAKTSIVTTVAKLLWAFDVTSEDGRPPDMSWETGITSGLVNGPRGFKPKLTPRGEERARVVAEQFQESEAFLSKWFS